MATYPYAKGRDHTARRCRQPQPYRPHDLHAEPEPANAWRQSLPIARVTVGAHTKEKARPTSKVFCTIKMARSEQNPLDHPRRDAFGCSRPTSKVFCTIKMARSEQNPVKIPQPGRPSRLEVYYRLATQITELHSRMGGLPSPDEASGIWEDIWHEEAHHSTAIEGNTLVLKQVKQLLSEGRAVGDKELREYLEVQGYANAATWVYKQAMNPTGLTKPGHILTLAEVREVHHRAMTPVWDMAPHSAATIHEAPGSFRRHDIRPFPGGMAPSTWPWIQPEMEGWIEDVNAVSSEPPVIPEALAVLHCRFEQIHPFLDGNGRTGRLVLNLILVRLGYPPALIYKRDRNRYLRALRRADNGDPKPLGLMIARALLDSLHRFIFPAIAGPVRLVPLAALATPELGATALRMAIRRGRLPATRGPDGQWRSSRQWVDEYKASRYRRQ